jgi:hypothetical protein
MDKRTEITRYVLNELQYPSDEKSIKKYFPVFWLNARHKETGGFRLTDKGYECFIQAGLKVYKVDYPEKDPFISNKLTIQLDQFIDCPFYLTKKSIMVFGEKMAVQLVLYSGDIQKYGHSKHRSRVANKQQ